MCGKPAEAGEFITISAVGDVMMGTTYPIDLLPPDDGAGMLDAVKEHFEAADIVFANLEGPLTDSDDQTKCEEESANCFAFRTPPRYASYLKDAGINVVNLANNHFADFGEEGMNETLEALGKRGLQCAGGEHIAQFIRKGKKIAVVGFSYMDASQFSYSINNIDKAKDVIAELKRSNDILIVSFHGGAEGKGATHVTGKQEEFLGEKRGNVSRFARAAVDAGADVVLGHGPHVLRAMEVYKGKLIAYSLGNFLVVERFNISGTSGISMVLRLRIDPNSGDLADGEIVPLKIVKHGVPVPDSKGRAIEIIRDLSASDIDFASVDIDGSGAFYPGGAKIAKESKTGIDRR